MYMNKGDYNTKTKLVLFKIKGQMEQKQTIKDEIEENFLN